MCPQSSDWSMTDAVMPLLGSRIRMEVSTFAGKTVHEGIVLPSAGEGHVTLKLVNGYNVSHPLTEVSSLEELSPPVESSSTSTPEVEFDQSLPLVSIIHTGGTIASKVDYATGAVVARFEPEEMLAAFPEMASIAMIKTVKLGNMWSDDMRPQHWNQISSAIVDAFADGAVGVVITQGTDTMHFTSAALSYMWAGNGQRPPGRIVLTGSQRSSDRGSTDAAENIMAAVYWAAHGPLPDGGLGDTAVIVMHSSSDDGSCAVLPGCAVRKSHSSRRDAFRCVNSQALAYVANAHGEMSHQIMEHYKPSDSRDITTSPTTINESLRICQLLAGPHLHADVINSLSGLDYDALFIQGTGLGHLPIEDAMGDSPENLVLHKAIGDWCSSGRIAVVSTQCVHGPVNLAVYSKGRAQQELGMIGHDSNTGPDSALIKLHYLLSIYGRDSEQIKGAWNKNLMGENPPNLQS
jgi:glutamyl-tRNA(Gln) amidotransferase subunit D